MKRGTDGGRNLSLFLCLSPSLSLSLSLCIGVQAVPVRPRLQVKELINNQSFKGIDERQHASPAVGMAIDRIKDHLKLLLSGSLVSMCLTLAAWFTGTDLLGCCCLVHWYPFGWLLQTDSRKLVRK